MTGLEMEAAPCGNGAAAPSPGAVPAAEIAYRWVAIARAELAVPVPISSLVIRDINRLGCLGSLAVPAIVTFILFVVFRVMRL